MAIIDDIKVYHDPAGPPEADPNTYEIKTEPTNLTDFVTRLNRLGYVVLTQEEFEKLRAPAAFSATTRETASAEWYKKLDEAWGRGGPVQVADLFENLTEEQQAEVDRANEIMDRLPWCDEEEVE